MYQEGSYKDKSDRMLYKLEQAYQNGKIDKESFKDAKDRILQAQKLAIEAVADYSFAGQYMKMVLHDDDMTEEERRVEFERARDELEKSDEHLREAISTLKDLIPGFTIAKTDAEMFVVATKLAHEYAMYAKVLEVKGRAGEKEFEEIMLASADTAKEYREAQRSCVFDKMFTDAERSVYEFEHAPSMHRLIETVDYGTVEGTVYNTGRLSITTMPTKALEGLKKSHEVQSEDALGYIDIIREDGSIDHRDVVMTWTDRYGVCMSSEEFEKLFGDMDKVISEVKVPEPPGGWNIPFDDEGRMKESSIIKNHYQTSWPEAQRRRALDRMWMDGENWKPPVTKTHLKQYLNLWHVWEKNDSCPHLQAMAAVMKEDIEYVYQNLDPKRSSQKQAFHSAEESKEKAKKNKSSKKKTSRDGDIEI